MHGAAQHVDPVLRESVARVDAEEPLERVDRRVLLPRVLVEVGQLDVEPLGVRPGGDLLPRARPPGRRRPEAARRGRRGRGGRRGRRRSGARGQGRNARGARRRRHDGGSGRRRAEPRAAARRPPPASGSGSWASASGATSIGASSIEAPHAAHFTAFGGFISWQRGQGTKSMTASVRRPAHGVAAARYGVPRRARGEWYRIRLAGRMCARRFDPPPRLWLNYGSPAGLVAQLVEQRTENPRVGGSTPSQATNPSTTCEDGGTHEGTRLSLICPSVAAQAIRFLEGGNLPEPVSDVSLGHDGMPPVDQLSLVTADLHRDRSGGAGPLHPTHGSPADRVAVLAVEDVGVPLTKSTFLH